MAKEPMKLKRSPLNKYPKVTGTENFSTAVLLEWARFTIAGKCYVLGSGGSTEPNLGISQSNCRKIEDAKQILKAVRERKTH